MWLRHKCQLRNIGNPGEFKQVWICQKCYKGFHLEHGSYRGHVATPPNANRVIRIPNVRRP